MEVFLSDSEIDSLRVQLSHVLATGNWSIHSLSNSIDISHPTLMRFMRGRRMQQKCIMRTRRWLSNNEDIVKEKQEEKRKEEIKKKEKEKIKEEKKINEKECDYLRDMAKTLLTTKMITHKSLSRECNISTHSLRNFILKRRKPHSETVKRIKDAMHRLHEEIKTD